MVTVDFEAAWERIKAVSGARTQVEIAKLLDIRQSSISDAKRRQTVPDTWLVALLALYGVNPEWIKTGQGAIYLTADTARDIPDGVRRLAVAAPEPEPTPEPTVSELKAALEAKLGDGVWIGFFDASDTVQVARHIGMGIRLRSPVDPEESDEIAAAVDQAQDDLPPGFETQQDDAPGEPKTNATPEQAA